MPSRLTPRRVSIAWELTGFFFAFGLVLSYGAFLAFGRVTTGIALRVGASVAVDAFESGFPVRDASGLRALAGAGNGRLSSLQRGLPFLASHDSFSGVRLYARSPGERWIRFAQGADGILDSSLASGEDAERLGMAEPERVYLRRGQDLFSGRAVPVYLRLPSGPDGTEWALGADVDATGVVDFLVEHRRETALFAAILAGLSLVLGRVFARRFTRPLIRLAGAAEEYSRGRSAVSFYSGRRDEIGLLGRTLAGMAAEVERRRVETESRLAAMEAMNDIDKAVLSTATRTELLSKVARIVEGTMHSTAVAIALRNESRIGWDIAALSGAPFRERVPGASSAGTSREGALPNGALPNGATPASRDEDFYPFVSDALLEPGALERFETYYDAPVRGSGLETAAVAYDVMSADSGRLVAAPLRVDGRYLGSLMVAADRDEPLTAEERRVFTMLADQAAVALRSILEHEAREENFLGVISALSRAIDAKSRWTAGHSERVARQSVGLGERLGLSSEELRNLRVSATLHDVGKIGVGEAVLDKPGRLSAAEYAEIKRHPSVGADMLDGIRSFDAIVPAVLHHHERWDGGGYPAGLSGEAIPLAARIVAVADVWDAIREDRPYRKGFPVDEAVRFMEDQSGLMFDPAVVGEFLSFARGLEHPAGG